MTTDQAIPLMVAFAALATVCATIMTWVYLRTPGLLEEAEADNRNLTLENTRLRRQLNENQAAAWESLIRMTMADSLKDYWLEHRKLHRPVGNQRTKLKIKL